MVRKVALAVVLTLAGLSAYAQQLTVRVSGIEQLKGNLRVGVYNSESTFKKTPFRGKEVAVTAKELTVVFTDLPKGTYAVAVIQDANKNGKLDTNFLGIPNEKYGFSNGSQSYGEASFIFNADKELLIKLQ